MNILISGATGFVGYHLVTRLIQKGHRITCIVRPNSNIERLHQFKIDFISWDDIHDQKVDFSQFDIVYHLASIRHKWGTRWEEYVASGQDYTELLLKSSIGKIAHFVFCSSVAVYGYKNKLPITEKSEKSPHNLYGKMKLECEKLIKDYHQKYNIPYTIVQPSIIYGENDPIGMMTRLVNMIKNNSYHTVGNGKNRIQCIYIEDFIDMLELVGTKFHPTNDEYIISYKYSITINKLVYFIREELHKERTIDCKIPLWIARCAAYILEKAYRAGIKVSGPEPVIAQEKIDTMVKDVSYDIQKVERMFDFQVKYSYDEGIKRLVHYMIQENRWKA